MGILNAGFCSGFIGIGFILAMSIPNIARSMLDFGLQVETVLSQSLEAKAEKLLNQKVNTTNEIRFLSILIHVETNKGPTFKSIKCIKVDKI